MPGPLGSWIVLPLIVIKACFRIFLKTYKTISKSKMLIKRTNIIIDLTGKFYSKFPMINQV